VTPPAAADLARLQRILGGPALAPLRQRLRDRFARGRASGVITLAPLTPEERATLAGLLGRRPTPARSLRVELSEIDLALSRAGLASCLRQALELLDGPIIDRAAERSARALAWSVALGEATNARLCAWIATASNRGQLKRLAGGVPETARRFLAQADRVLERLPAAGMPRSQLAAEALGDAHALDRGRPLATLLFLVLHGADERPRDTWARLGVLVNELAKPALALNLPVAPDTALGRLAALARDHGEPLHLSLRALLRSNARWQVRGEDVFVCENANLLAIAADRFGASCAPLVCTDGMPSASQRTLLRQLADHGARLRYHGDFDWPGINIGNYVLRTFGATAWRFDTQHYVPRLGRALSGAPIDASWDADLKTALMAGGYVLEEEAVAGPLLGDLAG
jgi:uncharacterized protein (TIGR02679 family)